MCDRVVDASPLQQSALARIVRDARTLVRHMKKTFSNEKGWRNLASSWNGSGVVGSVPMHVEFDHDRGCLIIGVPNSETFDEALLSTRTILALTRGAAGTSRRCTDLYSTMLHEAVHLGISVRMNCEDAAAHGVLEGPGVPRACLDRRVAWSEYIGKHVRDVLEIFKLRNTETLTIDSMWNKPPSISDPELVRIVYDPRTGLVVVAPFVSSAPPPVIDAECFSRADPGFKCIGAPFGVPEEWTRKYIGTLLPGTLDDLRMRFPHALIDPLPRTATVSEDRRLDRIRVRFDDAGVVTSVSLG